MFLVEREKKGLNALSYGNGFMVHTNSEEKMILSRVYFLED